MKLATGRFEVLFFLPQLGGGGAEMNAVRLATGLIAEGITPIYAVTRGPGSYTEFLPPGVEVIVFDTGRVNSSLLRLMRAIRPLAQLIDFRKPSVLCPVMVTPALAVLAALRLTRYRPATILSIQNSLSVSHEMDATVRDKIELQLIRNWFPELEGAIALSKGVAQELQRIVPQLTGRVKVVPNVGLPLQAQMAGAIRLQPKQPSPKFTLLACGRLTKQKDYPTLFRAFVLLRGQDIVLNILGDGELRQPLTKMAQDLGIAERVNFLGFQRDPYSYMRQADIFVLSSKWEGFGNVLIEAMAMGAPVVSTDCPHGPAEIIDNGRNGLLVPPSHPEALASAIQLLINDPDLRKRIGQAGHARAQDYSAERIGAEYARNYQAFAAGHVAST